MSIFDMEYPDANAKEVVVEGEALEGRKIVALPGPTEEDEPAKEEPDSSGGTSEDGPADDEDISDEFGGYDYQDPEEI